MANEPLMQLTITRIDGPVFNGMAYSVTVPGNEGEMTVLPHHEPTVSPLQSGTITVSSQKGEETFNLDEGLLEVSNNTVSILI